MGLLVLAVVALVAIGALTGGTSFPTLVTGRRYTLTFAIEKRGLLGFDPRSWIAEPSTAVRIGIEPGTGFELWTIAATWKGPPIPIASASDPNVVPAGLLLRGVA